MPREHPQRRKVIALAVLSAAYVAIVLVYLAFPAAMQVTVGGIPLGVIMHASFIAGVFATMAFQARPRANDGRQR